MAKVDKKVQITIDGGVYDHATNTIYVETKEEPISVPVDEFLESIDGYEIKIVASNQIED
jgi:hypothetical protein